MTMMTTETEKLILERIRSLEKQKEEVLSQTDSSSAKRIRREIRRLRARLITTKNGDQSSITTEKPHVKHPHKGLELPDYVQQIRREMIEAGLYELNDGKLPVNITTQAYDMVLGAEMNIPFSSILTKFKSRWNEAGPKWFVFSSNSLAKDSILYLGPIPKEMINEI